MGRKERGLLCPFREGAGFPSNSVAWAKVYIRTKWRLHPTSRLVTIDMGQKLGKGCALFFWGSWVPIEHKVAWAEAYLHTKRHLRPFSRLATTGIG